MDRLQRLNEIIKLINVARHIIKNTGRRSIVMCRETLAEIACFGLVSVQISDNLIFTIANIEIEFDETVPYMEVR